MWTSFLRRKIKKDERTYTASVGFKENIMNQEDLQFLKSWSSNGGGELGMGRVIQLIPELLKEYDEVSERLELLETVLSDFPCTVDDLLEPYLEEQG